VTIVNARIVLVGTDEMERFWPEIVEVYRRAFGADPYRENETQVRRFAEDALPRHAQRAGFRCVVAIDTREEAVGFAYGYVGGPGQWWYENVASKLGPQLLERWASDYFEFVELAVHPAMQRRGIGCALHDGLLDGVDQRTALLSTREDETPALRLYRRRGWRQLLGGVQLPGATASIVVLGRPLPFDELGS
jgi:ribosomal protein S18 acetylase RimI-like enzyme